MNPYFLGKVFIKITIHYGNHHRDSHPSWVAWIYLGDCVVFVWRWSGFTGGAIGEYDAARQAFIESTGATFLRFGNWQVYNRLDTVLAAIVLEIDRLRQNL
jgi:hypothetical protein